MKAFVIALTLAYASLIGCVNAQQKAIKGSGNIVTEERNVALFDKIKASRSIHVFLTQGENFTVKVEAEDNILPYIETNVLNHLLHLTLQEGINVKSREDIKVHVTLPKITALHASTSGKIKSTATWQVDNLDLNASTSGEIEIAVDANQIDIKASTSGEISLKGTTNVLNARASTSGDIDAIELIAKEVSAQASTSAEIRIHAVNHLEYTASTGGEVHYKGSPLLNGRVSTGGEIKRIQ
ncbi:head GIN domain-containing protein [Gabonibacter massiliensis]|mgnify:CR=1 FL=1|uniref:head GIN domain-containing protein n=1 Tax=Gabonibacter massiliensis TaxID=1720195 RepID=UPI00073F721A|nr:head GIN domain-containing protein [Gabonibacter massiliensis]